MTDSTPQPSEQPRTEWVRYRLTKGESELTFRVIRGTAMILEQSDWHVESEYIEGRTYAPDPVPSPALDQPLMIPMPKGTTLVFHMPILMDGHTDGSVHVYPARAAAPDPVATPALALGGSPLDRSLIRAAISNAYYECREAGESMETAADRAAHAVMELAPVATCDHTSTGRRTINGPDGRMAGAETFCVACGLVLRPDPVPSPPEAVTLLRRWLSAWRAMELGPPRADLVAATSRFVHSQEATDDLPVATPALDVERLARAIDASWADLLAPLGGQSEGLLRIAEKVAAEYARLGQPVAEEPER